MGPLEHQVLMVRLAAVEHPARMVPRAVAVQAGYLALQEPVELMGRRAVQVHLGLAEHPERERVVVMGHQGQAARQEVAVVLERLAYREKLENQAVLGPVVALGLLG